MTDGNGQKTDIEWLKDGQIRLEKAVKELGDKLDIYNEHFETKENAQREYKRIQDLLADKTDNSEFKPVKNIVFGLVSLILVAFFTALVALTIPLA